MQVIDLEEWPRKDHFRFFSALSFPFYAVTIPVDVTALRVYTKTHTLSFYHAMVWVVTQAMSDMIDFRYKIRGQDVFLVDRLHPSFVSMDEVTHLFKIINLELLPEVDLHEFCRLAVETEATQVGYFPSQESEPRDDFIYFSCTPWFSFTSISHEMDCNRDDSTPRVTWGKYEEQDGRCILPFNLQLNHRLLDGWHVKLLLEGMQKKFSALS